MRRVRKPSRLEMKHGFYKNFYTMEGQEDDLRSLTLISSARTVYCLGGGS